MRKGQRHDSFGTRCSQNEIIGVGIDVKAKVSVHLVYRTLCRLRGACVCVCVCVCAVLLC
jgi:hypothetical protein